MEDIRQCEASDRINDGPWIRCTNWGRSLFSWDGVVGWFEEEWLCPEHEYLLYEYKHDPDE